MGGLIGSGSSTISRYVSALKQNMYSWNGASGFSRELKAISVERRFMEMSRLTTCWRRTISCPFVDGRIILTSTSWIRLPIGWKRLANGSHNQGRPNDGFSCLALTSFGAQAYPFHPELGIRIDPRCQLFDNPVWIWGLDLSQTLRNCSFFARKAEVSPRQSLVHQKTTFENSH